MTTDGARMYGGSDKSAELAFYRRLLDLGSQSELEPLLDGALALIAEVTGASIAYLEIYDEADSARRQFWRAHNCDATAVATIRQHVSSGIIARAVAEGTTIETPQASTDPRFEHQASVRLHAIGAVLCAPVGCPSVGVVYLQKREGSAFSPNDRERVELFARQLAPIADRLLARRPANATTDHTKVIRRRFRCDGIVGRSEALARVLAEAANVAPLAISVLLTGPTGTGKSLLARAIADNSKRAQRPFVTINCASIPENLIESELFGAERGAHSTATQRVVGKVTAANGGTLFLDEVAELSLPAQAKLLQLLQERQYYPLGASAPLVADVRVISATHQDLRHRVASRQFREDLYYRLHVLPLAVPTLAERTDDIPDLVEHFCADACRQHGLAPMRVSGRLLRACTDASWPGNLRQLAHVIEAAVVRARLTEERTLTEAHVFPGSATGAHGLASLHDATREFRRRYLREALDRFDWNVTETARQLDLARGHLYTLIADLELKRDR